MAQSGSDLSAAEQRGLSKAVDDIVTSPVFGEPGLFTAVSGLAWWTAIAAAIMALKNAGVRPAALVLLGTGGLMTMHIPPIGPPALVCLSAAAYLIERHRASATASALDMRVVPQA
jgi:hypothetical protein